MPKRSANKHPVTSGGLSARATDFASYVGPPWRTSISVGRMPYGGTYAILVATFIGAATDMNAICINDRGVGGGLARGRAMFNDVP